MIQVKLADLSSAEQSNSIIELLNQYALHPMGGAEALSEFTRNHLISTLRSRNDVTIILAYDGNTAIGLCNCFEGFSTFASKPLLNIHDVYVNEDYRKQGVAKNMMRFAEKIAIEKGCCKVTLEVLTNNEAAKKSYLASGYKPYQLNEQFGIAEFWQKTLPDTQ